MSLNLPSPGRQTPSDRIPGNDESIFVAAFRIAREHLLSLYGGVIAPYLLMFLILFMAGRFIRIILPLEGQGPYDPRAVWLSMGWIAKVGVLAAFLFSVSVPYAVGASWIAMLTWARCEGETITAARVTSAIIRRLVNVVVLGFITAGAVSFLGMLFVLPGLIFAGMAGFALPALIIEDLGPLAALRRSFSLARGRAAMMIGLYFLAGVVLIVVEVFLGSALGALAESLWWFGLILVFLVGVTINILLVITLTLMYQKARADRERAITAG